jgi:hypothetical protein
MSQISTILKIFLNIAKNRTIMDRTIMDHDCTTETSAKGNILQYNLVQFCMAD